MLTASAVPATAHFGVICNSVPLNATALWGKVALDTGTASEGTRVSLCVPAGLGCAGDGKGREGHRLHVLGTRAWQHKGLFRAVRQLLVTSLPPSLPPPPLTRIACRAFLESTPCFNTCESGSQKRSGWLRGSDGKTMKQAAGVSEKLKGFLRNFNPLRCPFEKAHVNDSEMCVFTLGY